MFIAVKDALPIVHVFVDRLNAHVFTPVLKWPPSGQGVVRARMREIMKRRANQDIPDTSRETRQQRRRYERRFKGLNPAETARRKMRMVNGELCARASRQY